MIFRDVISDFSIPMQMVLVACAFLCGWIVLNTRRTMNWLARLGPSWWPMRETSLSMANKPVWIWVYRVDCAVIFAGIVTALVLHWLAR